MPGSIHTVRWIEQIRDQGWKVYLFPSIPNRRHNSLRGVYFCAPFHFVRKWLAIIRLEKVYDKISEILTSIVVKIFPTYFSWLLAQYLFWIRPDIIHSLETQSSGYLTYRTKVRYFQKKRWPPWWHTNWGSDIYLFGRLVAHQNLIRKVLEECSYYSCECQRDVLLAREFGFSGVVLPVYPNAGGFHIPKVDRLRSVSEPPSRRKIIMLKGYQGWTGRALVAIRALGRCADILEGYKVVIHSNTAAEDIQIAVSLFSQSSNVAVELLPENTNHDEILRYHSLARISIGLGISDGVSTSLLEAMAMGSYPIQSGTAAADEWIQDGVTGSIVPPEDPEIVEKAIRTALGDDELVDHASFVNLEVVRDRLSYEMLKQMTINSYKTITKKK